MGLLLSHKKTLPFLPPVSETEYHLAISFLTPHYFVTEKVKAARKAAWIHTDYSSLAVDPEEEQAMWAAYRRIIAISESTAEAFSNRFPALGDRLLTVRHMLPTAYIRRQAEALDAEREMPADGSLRLLSVGRFCYAKNFDSVPEICRRLRALELPVKWYLIGYGDGEGLIREKIEETGMREHVILLGKRANPYPYMKACDLYVQPSRYEGNSVCVTEAQILGKAVAITDYPTARDQVLDGVTGVIVPMETDACAQALAALLRDEKKLEALRKGCAGWDFSNRDEVQKVYRLL